jgi:hypothetical protein
MVADKAVVDAALSGWLVTARPQIRALTVENPLIGTMRAFGAQLGVVADVWAHSKRPTTSSSPSVLDVVLGAVLAAASKPGPPFPARPAIPSFPVTGSPAGLISDAARALISIDRLLPGAIPNPVALDEASWAALEAARRPGSVFAGRAAALRRSVPAAERARREQAERDFEAYGAIARRLVSPAAAAYMPRLDEILTKLHDEITGTRTRLPVRDLDDRPVMRPEIHRLRVRIGPGGDRASANAWVQMLRTRLDAHSLIRAVES